MGDIADQQKNDADGKQLLFIFSTSHWAPWQNAPISGTQLLLLHVFCASYWARSSNKWQTAPISGIQLLFEQNLSATLFAFCQSPYFWTAGQKTIGASWDLYYGIQLLSHCFATYLRFVQRVPIFRQRDKKLLELPGIYGKSRAIWDLTVSSSSIVLFQRCSAWFCCSTQASTSRCKVVECLNVICTIYKCKVEYYVTYSLGQLQCLSVIRTV